MWRKGDGGLERTGRVTSSFVFYSRHGVSGKIDAITLLFSRYGLQIFLIFPPGICLSELLLFLHIRISFFSLFLFLFFFSLFFFLSFSLFSSPLPPLTYFLTPSHFPRSCLSPSLHPLPFFPCLFSCSLPPSRPPAHLPHGARGISRS